MPSLAQMKEQTDANRRLQGPDGGLQLTGGDVAYARALCDECYERLRTALPALSAYLTAAAGVYFRESSFISLGHRAGNANTVLTETAYSIRVQRIPLNSNEQFFEQHDHLLLLATRKPFNRFLEGRPSVGEQFDTALLT